MLTQQQAYEQLADTHYTTLKNEDWLNRIAKPFHITPHFITLTDGEGEGKHQFTADEAGATIRSAKLWELSYDIARSLGQYPESSLGRGSGHRNNMRSIYEVLWSPCCFEPVDEDFRRCPKCGEGV